MNSSAVTANKTTCSLRHHDIAIGELRAHRKRERREIVEYSINMIKSRHPEWAENDPTWQKSWDYQSLPTT